MDGNSLDGCVPRDLGRFTSGINPQARGTMLPACSPGVVVWPTEGLRTTERNERAAFFNVLLEDRPEADVRIGLSSSDPGEGVMNRTELVIRPDGWYVTYPVAVRGVDDDARDGPQEYTAVLAPVESEDPDWRGVDPPDVQLTNLDDEPEGAPQIRFFEARPSAIQAGRETALYWEVLGETSVHVEPGIGGVTDDSVAVRPEETTTYTLTAVNIDGTATAEATVTVVGAPVIEVFRAVPGTIALGDGARLEWEVEGADSLFINGADVTDSTHLQVAPEETTTYELEAVNRVGELRQADTAEITVTVVANGPPVAHIAVSGCDDGNYRCTYDASGSTDPEDNIASYGWDMGDGTTLEGATVEHGYTASGRYTVVLTVRDRFGATGTADTVQVVNRAPATSFTSTCEVLACTFTSTSTDDGGIESWAWDFGDDGTGSDSVATHTYASRGSYDVTLTATDSLGAEASATMTVTVAANRPPVAHIAVSDCDDGNYNCAYDASGSTDPDGNIASYSWDMGDATALAGAAVEHGYEDPGRYTVVLTVTDGAGATGTADTAWVVNLPPEAGFASTCEQLACTFTSTSTDDGGIESWAWDFGDDGTGSGATATHTYESGGGYDVALTVTDSLGAEDDATRTVVVARLPAIDAFRATPDRITEGDTASLTWEVRHADSVFIDPGVGNVTDSTGVDVAPDATSTYTVTAVNAIGDSATAQVTVTVVPPPEVSISANPTRILAGDAVTISWTAENVRNVEVDGEAVTGTSGSKRDNPTGTTTYEITAEDLLGRSLSESVTVTVVGPRPDLSIRASRIRILAGDAVTISWTAENVRDVELDGDAVTGTSGSKTVNPTVTTTYEIEANDLLGRPVSERVTVTVVGPRPDLDIRASRTRILAGDAVTISWTAENVRNVEVDGEAVTGTSGSKRDNPTGTTTYEITAEDLLGRSLSESVTVTVVGPRPDLSIRASRIRILAGDAVTISWTAENVRNVEFDGEAVTGTSGSKRDNPTGTTTYEITAEDLLGRSLSESVTVTVVGPRPDLSIRASRIRILAGDAVTISWTAENVRNLEFDGEAVTGTSGSKRDNPTGTTTYEITAEDLLGRSLSESVTVTVVGPRPDLDIRASRTRILAGDAVRLEWWAENVRNVEVDGVAVTGTSGSKTVNPTVTTTYEIEANDLLGRPVSASVTVTVVGGQPTLGPLEADRTRIFHNESVTLTWREENVRNVQLNGRPVSGGSETVTPPDGETRYVLTAENLLSDAVDGGSETITSVARPVLGPLRASSDEIYEEQQITLMWQAENVRDVRINDDLVSGTSETVDPPLGTTTYALTANDLHDSPVDGGTVTVTSVRRPVLEISADPTLIPRGASTTLTWTAENVFGPRINGSLVAPGTDLTRPERPDLTMTYTLSADSTLIGDPVASVTATVEVDQPPMASFEVVYCSGLTCRFQSTSTDDRTNSLTHAWSFGGGNDSSPIHTYSSRGVHTVTLTVTDESGQTDSASGSVDVSDFPVARFTAGCNELDCVFDARQSSDDENRIIEYFWTLGTETASGELVSHEFDAAGTYSVTLRVTDRHGNATTASGSVTTGTGTQRSGNTPPRPDFTVDCLDLECTFTSTSTDNSGIVSWAWSTGDDAEVGTKSRHEHRYDSAGSYTVVLAVRDEQGALGVMAYWITVPAP